jgi:GNAT superfamily N-acetyltransferase
MRLTLVEVLGEEAGAALYSLDWLRERVHWHLEPAQCTGQVLLAEEQEGCLAGHLIVRLERGEDGAEIGLISTIYVDPSRRRRGIGARLLEAGETWIRAHAGRVAVYDTAETHAPMIRLLEARGYVVTFAAADKQMVRLSKALP